MTLLPNIQTPHIQAPSLDNQSARDWDAHAQLAYCFARHARHDLANIHCALGMLEMVEQIQADHPELPLPEELNLENIRIKARQDVKKVISFSNDLILLSQSAAMPPYESTQTLPLASLVQQHIVDRLADPESHPIELLSQAAQTRVLAMGDMLGVALCAFYCQWSPWSQSHDNAANTTVTPGQDQVNLHIPADNTEMLSQFAHQLQASQPNDPLAIPLQHHLTTSTGTMALWLARHIILVHGGYVSIEADHTASITLPTVD